MSVAPLLHYLSELHDLSGPFTAELSISLHTERYKAHQIIVGEGQIENRLWFMSSGFARCYFLNEDGSEQTIRFWLPGDFIFSYQGYWKTPSDVYIEILDSSELLSLTYKKLDVLLKDFPETKVFTRAIILKQWRKDFRRTTLNALHSEERYRLLRKESPLVFKHAPLRMIASYLEMSRESLSRLISKEGN
ncbi:Crp/Fnr family transcriptional regulator [Mucilaginibacter paludis]|uniref:Transcriptional regulator, Crp/Fnr family n=1 Tax=Mucilaginibacter paludis DSM 18603 TaxID=714943 RepID=H1Y427_9SPHI|nr:Crp/Fnr family transcriptional regulator [Mucilaginibacter paludis]EHQ24763.1 putative transcriptional regulator, Crp/Fnr family [Mucilaginibacter paludis DSM 18603]